MNIIKIKSFGNVPEVIQKNVIDKFDNQESSRDNIFCLHNEIEFIVCELKVAHGNFNVYSKDAWFSPKNNDGSFNVKITW